MYAVNLIETFNNDTGNYPLQTIRAMYIFTGTGKECYDFARNILQETLTRNAYSWRIKEEEKYFIAKRPSTTNKPWSTLSLRTEVITLNYIKENVYRVGIDDLVTINN